MADMEQLEALNREIIALQRIGVPLDLGLQHLSRDPDAAAAKIHEAVGRELRRGKTIGDAILEPEVLPDRYVGVLQAGILSERLPAGLESLTTTAQTNLKVRQTIGAALLYPIVICSIVYLLFVSLIPFTTAFLGSFFGSFGTQGGTVFRVTVWLVRTMPYWGAIPPILGSLFLYRWLRKGDQPGSRRPFSLGVLMGRFYLARDHQCAELAEVASELVRRGVSMGESLRIASMSSGSNRLANSGERVCAALEAGDSLDEDSASLRGFPPFLRWAITAATGDDVSPLQLAAEIYRGRAEYRHMRICRFAPALLCILIGGTVTFLYCLAIFIPIVSLILNLS